MTIAMPGVCALRIPAGSYEYWIEHRQLVPAANFPFGVRLRDGVLILWSKYPASVPGLGTYLLDATPNSPPVGFASPGSAAGFDDAPFVIGQTFTDPDRGISITPTAKGGSAPAEWIDVRIDFGATGTNRNPTLAASAPTTIVPARTDVTFIASATDPDGDPVTIQWNFGENQAGFDRQHRDMPVHQNAPARCNLGHRRAGRHRNEVVLVTVDDPDLVDTARRWTHHQPSHGSHSRWPAICRRRLRCHLTSPDGTAWTRRQGEPPKPATVWRPTAHGSWLLTYRATLSAAPTAALIATSMDGMTADGVVRHRNPRVQDVPGPVGLLPLARGVILQSSDKAAWAAATSGTTQDLHDVHFAARRFVAIGPTARS